MNKNLLIALVAAAGFVAALVALWGKGNEKTPPTVTGTVDSAGEEKPAPQPAGGDGNRPPRPLPLPLPAEGPEEPEPTSRFLDVGEDALESFAKNQESAVPWLEEEEKEKPGAEPSGPSYETHTVETTTSLVRLAEELLGDGERWREILALNADVIRDRERIPRGTVLRVPERRTSSLLDRLGTGRGSKPTKLTDLID